ncbi:MAG: DUF4240 domain-containing protein [Bacteroidota bacterium]
MDVHHLQVELIRLITDIRNEEFLKHIRAFIQEKEIDKTEQSFSETSFWKVIEQLDWEATEANDVLAPAVQYLSYFSSDHILKFYDLLSEKLYLLDGEQYADFSVQEEDSFSADLFLYARCAVVANGRNFYENVLNHPKHFPKNLYFEALLDLPSRAYALREKHPLNYVPKFMYETGFNVEGWGEKAIQL